MCTNRNLFLKTGLKQMRESIQLSFGGRLVSGKLARIPTTRNPNQNSSLPATLGVWLGESEPISLSKKMCSAEFRLDTVFRNPKQKIEDGPQQISQTEQINH
jgi:hypothetical protein